MLSSVYLVEYTLHQNLMIEIYTRNFDLHITVPSPNLAFLCRNLDYIYILYIYEYKSYSIIRSIINLSFYRWSYGIDMCFVFMVSMTLPYEVLLILLSITVIVQIIYFNLSVSVYFSKLQKYFFNKYLISFYIFDIFRSCLIYYLSEYI